MITIHLLSYMCVHTQQYLKLLFCHILPFENERILRNVQEKLLILDLSQHDYG
jgi:hypothetical protein